MSSRQHVPQPECRVLLRPLPRSEDHHPARAEAGEVTIIRAILIISIIINIIVIIIIIIIIIKIVIPRGPKQAKW